MMSFSALLRYAHSVLTHVPWPHWVVIGLLSLALTVYLVIRKRYSTYGAICLGISVLIGLFLLDAAVFSRLTSTAHPEYRFSLAAEYHRLIQGGTSRWTEMLANFAAFIPFGLLLSEFLASAKRFSAGRRLGLATLAGFGLSLCIECLQLLLRVGFFELTDLVMNTLGAFVGALISAGLRKVVGERRRVVSVLIR